MPTYGFTVVREISFHNCSERRYRYWSAADRRAYNQMQKIRTELNKAGCRCSLKLVDVNEADSDISVYLDGKKVMEGEITLAILYMLGLRDMSRQYRTF